MTYFKQKTFGWWFEHTLGTILIIALLTLILSIFIKPLDDLLWTITGATPND